MQISLHFPPDSHHFPFPWKTHFNIQIPTLKTLQLAIPKTLNLSNSLKTSFNYEVDKGDEPPTSEHLSVVIRKPGSVLQYVWDGNCFAVSSGGRREFAKLVSVLMKNLSSFCGLGVRNFFIPQRFSGNYLDYVKWKFLHRVFSSALQVLATQVASRFTFCCIPIFSAIDLYGIYHGLNHVHLQTLTKKRILLCVREGASTTDVSMGLLQACYIRKRLMSNNMWNDITEASDSVLQEWFEVIGHSKQCAQADSNLLNAQMWASGWSIKRILLSTQEQARYSFLDDYEYFFCTFEASQV